MRLRVLGSELNRRSIDADFRIRGLDSMVWGSDLMSLGSDLRIGVIGFIRRARRILKTRKLTSADASRVPSRASNQASEYDEQVDAVPGSMLHRRLVPGEVWCYHDSSTSSVWRRKRKGGQYRRGVADA
eukprot:3941684-Rhodomonas_salina.1